MLDLLRRSTTSVFAWIILGLLALAFGFSFGLPSDSLTFGPAPLVEVHGERIGDEDYRYQFNLIRRVIRVPKDPRFQQLMGFKEEVLEAAVEREVLADAADDLGLAATTRDAEDLVANGHLIVMGETYDWLGDMAFDYDIFTNSHLRSIQISEKKYLDAQRKEYLARTVRDLVASSVAVGDGELRRLYEASANRLSIQYARYESRSYSMAIDPTPEEIDAWVAEHTDELEADFAAQGSRFTKLPEQVRLWVIEVPEGDDEDAAKAARKTASQAKGRIAKGEDFRKVAREVSTHATAPAGGDYGWVSVGSGSGLDPAVDELLGTLGLDAVSDVLEGESSLFVIALTGKRAGDVPKEDALRELAQEAIKVAKGKELARAAAQGDLDRIEGGASPGEVFASGSGGIEDVALDDETPDDEPDDEPDDDEAPADAGPKVALRETGPFGKSEPVPGLGPQTEMVEAVWATQEGSGLVGRIFEVEDDFVLAGLASKQGASDEGFEEARNDLYAQAVQQKGALVTARWAARRCLEAKGKGDIVAAEDKISRIITYDMPEQEEAPQLEPYSVCDRVGNRGGLLRAGLMGGG